MVVLGLGKCEYQHASACAFVIARALLRATILGTQCRNFSMKSKDLGENFRLGVEVHLHYSQCFYVRGIGEV